MSRLKISLVPPRLWSVDAALIAAVLFGIICRLSQYAAGTSMWHDEAFVALNVLHKSFAGLLGPLDWHEPAPPAFLAVEKLVIAWLGRSEYAFRLVPLLAGLVGLVSFALLARHVCGARTALWAVVLMAASDKLIAQANEVKHFTLDLLAAVLLTGFALRIWRGLRPAAALLIWGLCGALSIWLSFASLFVFAGTSLALGWRFIHDWLWQERAVYLLANLWVLISLALLAVPIHAQLTNAVVGFWSSSFADTHNLLSLSAWLLRSLLGLFNYCWQPFGAILLVLGWLGGVVLWRTQQRPEVVLLASPILLALMASFVQRWPFGGNQHMVFAAPALLLLIACGIEDLGARLRSRPRVTTIALGVLLLPGVLDAAYHIVVPRLRHEVRPVIAYVQQHRQPDDQLLVFCPAEAELYTGTDFRGVSTVPDAALRVWFVGTRTSGKPFGAQTDLDRLRILRPQLDAFEAHGAAAYLFGPERPPLAASE